MDWLPVAPTPWGTGGTCPHLYKWLGTGSTVSRRTANKKLTKLYWPSRKSSPKRLIVLLEPKRGGARPKKKNCRRFAPDRRPPLSNSFRRHCWLLPLGNRQWRQNEFESGGTHPARSARIFLSCLTTFVGCTSTISRLGERFRVGLYSLVSFLFAVLLLTVSRAQPFVKVGARAVWSQSLWRRVNTSSGWMTEQTTTTPNTVWVTSKVVVLAANHSTDANKTKQRRKK